jgi:hypothetical protein
LWVVTPCIVVVGYRRFRGPCCLHVHCSVVRYRRFRCPCCLHLQDRLQLVAAWTSETSVSYRNIYMVSQPAISGLYS